MDTCEYDFNRICRACKNESNDLCSVFNRSEALGRNARLDEMLMACTSIQVNKYTKIPPARSICVSEMLQNLADSNFTLMLFYILHFD